MWFGVGHASCGWKARAPEAALKKWERGVSTPPRRFPAPACVRDLPNAGRPARGSSQSLSLASAHAQVAWRRASTGTARGCGLFDAGSRKGIGCFHSVFEESESLVEVATLAVDQHRFAVGGQAHVTLDAW